MSRLGPIYTLLAGAVLAGSLGVLSAQVSPAPERAPQPTPEPVPTVALKQTVPPRGDYAGQAESSRAFIAIAVRNGKAIAYVCDGRRTEAWLRGDAADGLLELSNDKGGRVTGTYGDDAATGTIILKTGTWTFNAPTAKKPAGLYRVVGKINDEDVTTGWVVLPDGRRTGISNYGGDDPRPAPPDQDPAAGPVTIGGVQVTPQPVEP